MSGAAVSTVMARTRAAHLMAQRPECGMEALVFDAVAALPNPPTVPVIAHWVDLAPAQVRKALDRLLRRGVVVDAGYVPRRPQGRWQTYRVSGA